MQPIAYKMLFRKKGTASAIVAIVLLIALVTSVNCLVNNLNSKTNLLSKLSGTGDTYLVMGKNSTSLSDSKITPAAIVQIKNISNIQSVIGQRVTLATLETGSGNYSVTVRGVDDLGAYFKSHPAIINGSISQTDAQADIGILLAQQVSVNKNDQFNLTINGKTAELTVAGVVQTAQQTDAEVTLPLATLDGITQNSSVSFIEFSIKDPAQANLALANITQTLPSDIKITAIQQVTAFAQDINNQTVAFINLWSIAIYVVVAAASYVVASRVVNEAQYELGMLRTLGAKKKVTFNLILVYVLTIGLVGSVVGLSAGIVGTQFASTFVRWIWGSTLLAPFLELNQAFWILLFAFAASFVGSIYPALRVSYSGLGVNPG